MRKVMAALGLTASLAIVCPAAADNNDVVQQSADQSLKAGLSWFKKGDYQRALLEFEKADAVYPRGSLMRNMGLCELKLGRPLDALKHFRGALAAPDTKPEQRDLTQQDMEDAYAATGHIVVHANDGAIVSLDGEAVGPATKDPLDVIPGAHTVEARVGSQNAKADVVARAGVIVTADVLVPLAAAPPTQAAVPSPPSPPPSATMDVDQPPADQPRGFWTVRREIGVGVAGLGVLALVGAEIFHVQAQNAQSNATGNAAGLQPSACNGSMAPASCSSLSGTLNGQRQDATWEAGLLVTGAVALAAGAALFLWPQSPSGTQAAIAPYATPNGSGLQVRGEF